jgi:hypothetical protein
MTARVSEEIRNGLIEDYSKGIEDFLREFTGNSQLASDMELAIRGLMLLATNPRLESNADLLKTVFTPKMMRFLYALCVCEFAIAAKNLNGELGIG